MEDFEEVMNSVINGQWMQARRQFDKLETYDKEAFIIEAFDTGNEKAMQLCKLLLIHSLD